MSLPSQARPAGVPPEGPSQSIDPRDLIWRLKRYGWLLVLPVVTCLCVAWIYTRHTKPVYQAFLVVSVDDPADMSPGLRPYVQGGNEGNGPRERIALLDGKIHNHTFLTAVAQRMGMDRDPVLLARANEALKQTAGITPAEYALRLAVGELWGKISVGVGRGTSIQITARDTSPAAARDMAAIIGDVLLEQSLQSTLERAQARGSFSNDQIAVQEERVKQAEDALRIFQESHLRTTITAGLSSEADLQAAQSLQRSTDEEISQLRTRILAAGDEWRSLAGSAVLPSLSSSQSSDLAAQLNKLETTSALTQLGPRTGSAGGEAEAVRGRITSLRQALFVEFDRLSQAMAGDVTPEARSTAAGIALDRAVLRSLQGRRDRLESAIGEYVANVQRSPRDQLQLQKLQDDLASARGVLTTLRNEANSSRLSEALATSQVGPRLEILEHPLLPLTPSSLGASATYGVALFLGLVIDAVIVFMGERVAAVIRTVEQAEAEYGLRVVGVVPRIMHRPKPGGYLRNHWPKFAILGILLVTVLVVVVEITVFPQPTKTGQVQR